MAAFLFTVLLALFAGVLGRGLDPHIIGGEEAAVGAWPWQGLLQLRDGRAFCGCSLLSTRWVITAAHCVSGKLPGDWKVVLGLHDRKNSSMGKPADYLISQIISHPGYETGKDDIALLKLSTPAVLNDYVKTITLPQASANFDNKDCYITGWGVTQIGGSTPPTRLQEAAVTAFTNEFCKNYWSSITEGQICSGVIGQRGCCFGDSGSPLVCNLGSGYVLAGLTSFGYRECNPAVPSVYTRITYHRTWIQENTGL